MPIINPTLPNDGETIDASDVNNPFNAILGVLNGGIDSNNLAAGAVTLANMAAALTPFLVPTGAIVPFGGNAAPTGWLMCDGSSLLRASYPSLFAALSTNYGSVDGTHFSIPDLRGRVPVGTDGMQGGIANRIQRSTTINTTSGSNSIVVTSASNLAIGMTIISANVTAGTTITAISGTTVTMSANATATASGTAARFSMFAGDSQNTGAAGGNDVWGMSVYEMPTHYHGLNGGTMHSQAGGSYSHVNSTGSWNFSSNLNTDTTAAASGGSLAHQNLQPSQTTNYIIKT